MRLHSRQQQALPLLSPPSLFPLGGPFGRHVRWSDLQTATAAGAATEWILRHYRRPVADAWMTRRERDEQRAWRGSVTQPSQSISPNLVADSQCRADSGRRRRRTALKLLPVLTRLRL